MALAGFLVLTAGVWGGILPPLYVGNVHPVLDPWGRPMQGTQLPGGDPLQSLVEIRVATRPVAGYPGIIYPPDTNGVAHPSNPLVNDQATGRLGMNALGTDSGLFCMAFSERLPTDNPIFVRVYNAPTIAAATFYADSYPMDVPVSGRHDLEVQFRPAMPIDWRDCNDNGIQNSWEQFLAAEAELLRDFDGDGVSDYHEWLAGTDWTDPDCFLGFRSIGRAADVVAPAGAGGELVTPFRVRWQVVPGRAYQLEYARHLADDPASGEPGLFVPVGEPTVAGPEEYDLELLVDVPIDYNAGFFRVRALAD